MRMRFRIAVAALAVAAGWLLLSPPGETRAGGTARTRTIQIGLADSIFRDAPPSLIRLLSRPLKALMESQTGISGELSVAGDAEDLAQKLKDNKIQLGVFHGFEFAWARLKNPDLKPLVIAVTAHPVQHAYLVVRKDSPASDCGDLKGKVVALPHCSREHCRLYLNRHCPGGGANPKEFFSQVARPTHPELALDDVVDDVVQAVIVDRAALDAFRRNKPGRAAQLRVLHKSEGFPAAVVAYQPGVLDESTLRRFRDGMIRAHKSARGKQLLKMCRITSFRAVPADYESMLKDILKAYPPVEEGQD